MISFNKTYSASTISRCLPSLNPEAVDLTTLVLTINEGQELEVKNRLRDSYTSRKAVKISPLTRRAARKGQAPPP
jgi:hypothetical protein